MQAIPQQGDCCTTCTEAVTVAVPGAAGADGAAGAQGDAGEDGLNCCTETTAIFAMPAEGATVVVAVVDNQSMFAGMIVQVENCGYMEVAAIPGGSTTSVTLQNIEDSTTGQYPDNVAPATNVASGSVICPSGPTGPTGADNAPDDAEYWCATPSAGLLNEVDMSALASGYVKVTTGTGQPSSVDEIPDEDIEYDEQAIPGTFIIDWDLGRTFYRLLAADTIFTFANTVAGKQILVVLRQGNGPARTAAFPATVMWAGGVAPTMTITSLAYAVFSFYKCEATGDIIGTVLNDAY